MFPPKRGMGVVQNNKMFWVTFGTKTILEFWTEKGCVLTPLGSEIMGGGGGGIRLDLEIPKLKLLFLVASLTANTDH